MWYERTHYGVIPDDVVVGQFIPYSQEMDLYSNSWFGTWRLASDQQLSGLACTSCKKVRLLGTDHLHHQHATHMRYPYRLPQDKLHFMSALAVVGVVLPVDTAQDPWSTGPHHLHTHTHTHTHTYRLPPPL